MTFRSLIPFRLMAGSGDGVDNFLTLQREMNRMFDDLWRGAGASAPVAAAQPLRLDVRETDKSLEIHADVPGIAEKDIAVEIHDQLLTIRAERKLEKQQDEKGWHLVERSYGQFSRSLALPFEVDQAKAQARFQNGVLTITLPKAEAVAAKSRRIEIKAA